MFIVLLPYEITLFSNKTCDVACSVSVLLPYEITLFSNKQGYQYSTCRVLLPYEITLFSNSPRLLMCNSLFYYLMKLHYSQTY